MSSRYKFSFNSQLFKKIQDSIEKCKQTEKELLSDK